MDQRVEAFLADVLALEGETPDAIRQAVRASLADCEAVFRAQEANRRMKEKAAQACHSLCRARVAEELRRRKGRRRQNTYTWSSVSSTDQNSRREISLLGILSDADQHRRRSWLNAKSELPDEKESRQGAIECASPPNPYEVRRLSGP